MAKTGICKCYDRVLVSQKAQLCSSIKNKNNLSRHIEMMYQNNIGFSHLILQPVLFCNIIFIYVFIYFNQFDSLWHLFETRVLDHLFNLK